MKRFLIYCLVLAFMVAIPLSHTLMAKKVAKVKICHVNSANDVFIFVGQGMIVFGRVIEVSPKAVPAHERHGDSTYFEDSTSEMWDDVVLYAELMEIELVLTNADCMFPVAIGL